MTRDIFSVRSLAIFGSKGSAADPSIRSALAQVLLAEVVNDLTLVLEELLLEVDPEAIIRRTKGGGEDSDVRPLDSAAEQSLQSEVCGADAFDPAAPHEDLEVTLDERHPINQRQPNPHE